MKVLVTGATGFIGSHLVPALLEAGHSVRALARGVRPASLPQAVELVRGSVADEASVRAAAAGVDACVHLVAVIVERRAQTFDAINRRGTENVVSALEAAGVPRLVHMSALGVGPFERFPYLWTKWRGEEAVRSSSLDWTILRPGAVFGARAGFFRPIVWTLRWMPAYPLPNGGTTRFQPIAVEDVARAVLRCLEGAGSKETIEFGGPEVLTFRDIVQVALDALGKRRKMIRIPLWAARPFALVQQIRKDPLVTNDQLDMVVLDNVTDLDSTERAFGFRARRMAETDLRWLAEL